MSIESYGIFLVASFFLWVTPGQDSIYIIARSVSQGRLAGIVSVLGISTGAPVHAALATAGVSIIILASPILFLLVKIIGGLYLIYLGLNSLLSKSTKTGVLTVENTMLTKIYLQGVLTNVLNPKVALFFIAFLPQFASSNGAMPNLLFLSIIFVSGGTVWCIVVACFASSFSSILSQSSTVKYWLNKCSGMVYIGLGLNVLRTKV